MAIVVRALLATSILLLSGCVGGSKHAEGSDAAGDVSARDSAVGDASTDSARDSGGDATVDSSSLDAAAPDATHDATLDATEDTTEDAIVDAAVDAGPTAFELSLPYMIHGSPSSRLFQGSFAFLTGPAAFETADGGTMPASAMRFVDFFVNTYTFAMQAGSNEYFVWRGSPWSSPPICRGALVDATNAPLNADQLSHVIVGDFDGSGQMQVFAVTAATATYARFSLGLSLAAVNCTATPASPLGPEASGVLSSSQGAVAGQALAFVLPADLDASGVQEIVGVPTSGTSAFVWGREGDAGGVGTATDLPLGPVAASAILSVVDNRQATGGPLAANNNVPGGAELFLQTADGVGALRPGASPAWMPNCHGNAAACAGTTLLVSLDEAIFNEPEQALTLGDAGAGAVATLAAQLALVRGRLQAAGLDLAVLVNPVYADKKTVNALLSVLAGAGVPFVLDVLTSSSQNIAFDLPTLCPDVGPSFEPLEGTSLDLMSQDASDPSTLAYYVATYPGALRGVRIMEQLGVDLTHLLCRYYLAEGMTPTACFRYQANEAGTGVENYFYGLLSSPALSPSSPSERFLGWSEADGGWTQNVNAIARTAEANHLFVLWSDDSQFDPFEFEHTGWDPALTEAYQAERAAYLSFQASVSAAFPNTVVAAYDNNEGTKVNTVPGQSPPKVEIPRNFRLDTWPLAPSVLPTAHGWGLSNQSWTSGYHIFWTEALLPPGELVTWTTSAINGGSKWLELEPLWYFFQWPRGSNSAPFTPAQGQDPCIGLPTWNLVAQLQTLGVSTAGLSLCTR